MTRIEVDFNSRDGEGMVPALAEDADGPMRVGDAVEAYDDEGYRCLAVVVARAGDIVALDPVWRAFAAPSEARVILIGTPPAMWADWRNRLTVALSPVSIMRPVSSTTGREPAVA